MTAKRSVAKNRRVVVRSKSSSRKKYTPPKLPSKPKVTVGPRSYGLTKRGRRIVVRFYVSRRRAFRGRGISKNWYVIDYDEGIAKTTNPDGYESRSEAIGVARKLRDEYGAWSRSPF